ncbi:protein of unknown function, partial [Pseudomonas asturiensis]
PGDLSATELTPSPASRLPRDRVSRELLRGLQRTEVIEFESDEQAIACYRSPEYQDAIRHRQGASRAYIVIVEGMA